MVSAASRSVYPGQQPSPGTDSGLQHHRIAEFLDGFESRLDCEGDSQGRLRNVVIPQRHRSEYLVTASQGNVITVYAGNAETLIKSERMQRPRVIDAAFDDHVDFGPMVSNRNKVDGHQSSPE